MSWGVPTSLGSKGQHNITSPFKISITGLSVSVGSFVVVSGVCQNSSGGSFFGTPSVTDDVGNTYTFKKINYDSSNYAFAAYANINAALVSQKITFTQSTTSLNGYRAAIAAISEPSQGLEDTGVYITATGSSTSPASTGGTASAAGTLAVAVTGIDIVSDTDYTEDTGHGWTNLYNFYNDANHAVKLAMAYQINSGTSGLVHAPTLSVTDPWMELQIAFTEVTGYNVTPGSGSLALTKYAPKVGMGIIPAAAALSFTKYAPTISRNLNLTPGVRALVLSGYSPIVGRYINITPDAGTLTLVQYAPDLGFGTVLTPDTGVLALGEFAPFMDYGLVPGAGTLTLTSYTVSITGSNFTLPSGALTLAGYAASLDMGITVGTGSLGLTGYAPDFVSDLNVVPGAAALTLTGYDFTLDLNITPNAGVLTLTTYLPHVSPQSLPPPILYIPAENRTVGWPGDPT